MELKVPQQPNIQNNAGGYMKIQLPRFKGKRTENPDTHVNEFEMVSTANGHVKNAHKLRYFPCTLRDIAMEWYVQFERGHFVTWDALRTAFLVRFRQEKTPVQLMQRLCQLKQGRKEPVDEFVGRLCTLYNHLDVESKPSATMLIGWFVEGLWKEYRAILAIGAAELSNLDDAIKIASRIEHNTHKPRKSSEYRKSTSSESDSSKEEASGSESGSDVEGTSKGKLKSKLKKVEAMMTKLKTGGSTSTFRPGVYCPKCSNEGHTKEECKLPSKFCAICITTTNHTTDMCRYNGTRREITEGASAPQANTMNAVPPPRTYGRGRLPEGICWYCRQPGHRKPDCPLWKRHQAEIAEIKPIEAPTEANVNMVMITPWEAQEIPSYIVTRSQGNLPGLRLDKKGKCITWEDQEAMRYDATQWVREAQLNDSMKRKTTEDPNSWAVARKAGLGMPGFQGKEIPACLPRNNQGTNLEESTSTKCNMMPQALSNDEHSSCAMARETMIIGGQGQHNGESQGNRSINTDEVYQAQNEEIRCGVQMWYEAIMRRRDEENA